MSIRRPHSTFNIKHSTFPVPPFSVLFIAFSPDPRPDRVESLLDPLVAAVDLMDVVDHALAFRTQRGERQRHAGADVGAGDFRAVQPVATDDDGGIRSAE